VATPVRDLVSGSLAVDPSASAFLPRIDAGLSCAAGKCVCVTEETVTPGARKKRAHMIGSRVTLVKRKSDDTSRNFIDGLHLRPPIDMVLRRP
jgi:hypothetical protein